MASLIDPSTVRECVIDCAFVEDTCLGVKRLGAIIWWKRDGADEEYVCSAFEDGMKPGIEWINIQ